MAEIWVVMDPMNEEAVKAFRSSGQAEAFAKERRANGWFDYSMPIELVEEE